MQFSRNTSISHKKSALGILIKLSLVLFIVIGVVVMLGKINFPSPNKKIEKTIPNEKLKIIK